MRSSSVVNVTLIGDSTLDNRIWVDGIFSNYLWNRVGIVRDPSAEIVKKSQRVFLKPRLSVIESLMVMLPEYAIHDYTNDGFTTEDCIRGAPKDKVFGKGNGTFSLFPNEFFIPLQAAEEDIEKSQFVVVSIGGNDVREFLQEVARTKSSPQKSQFIRNQFKAVLKELKNNYLQILNKIRELNANAKIILMSQYYPSAIQNNYHILELMREIGEALSNNSNPDPMIVLHDIMKQTYTDILKNLTDSNVAIADITSTLNPFDNNNHVSQIEPSATGGKKIAQALKFLLTTSENTAGNAYRFYPDFFTTTVADQHKYVQASPFDTWVIASPYDLREGYSLAEENFYRENNLEITKATVLLQQLENAKAKFPEASATRKAADKIAQEGIKLLTKLMRSHDFKKWKMSMGLAIAVLNHPDNLDTIRMLQANGQYRATGAADNWSRFKAALVTLTGTLILGLAAAGIPFTGGASLIACYAAGGLLTGTGATFFYRNTERGLASSLTQMANVTQKVQLRAR